MPTAMYIKMSENIEHEQQKIFEFHKLKFQTQI